MTSNLTGSEKQIQWAEDIRSKTLAPARVAEVETMIATYAAKQPAAAAAVRKALDIVTAEASAAWWIDNRDQTLKLLVGRIGKSLM